MIIYQKNKQFKRSIWRLFFSICLFFTLTLVFSNITIHASNEYYLIEGGDAIGFKLETGVYIAGKYSVLTKEGKKDPWKNSDIQNGDKIISINKHLVNNNQEVQKYINMTQNDSVELRIQRGKNQFTTIVDIIESSTNELSIGLYIKDQLLGIGTLTFIDPNTGYFGSLGHGIYDEKVVIGTMNGTIMESNITSIVKGEVGSPGEKRAILSKRVIGNIYSNTSVGVFGKIKNIRSLHSSKQVPVAKINEVQVGKAKINTVIANNKIESYDIEILEVVRQLNQSIKGIKIKVTDPRLIQETGGIIQGMSGSPIIQNGKIVGAVSHVTVDNPLIGYGMHIEWMLQEVTKLDN